MKKKLIIFIFVLSGFALTGCVDESVEQVAVPDFYGMNYGDAIRLANDLNITLNPSSEYNDDVEPNSIFSQGIEAGVMVDAKTSVDVSYSRGYDPEGIINVPDFSGKTEKEIRTWITENDIKKYAFFETFSSSIEEAGYVGYEVLKFDERTEDFRKDTYNFFFSKGDIIVEDVEFDNPATIRGVNLGGWFVLEGWMTPSLFNGVNGSDETAFLQQKPDAENEIINHWDTFITEDDFIWLEEHGVEYVRLPIPWWMWGVENAYEGTEHEVTYISSVTYIDRAMVWAEDHNIKVLIDLHAAPGCQNGFDNGGIAGTLEWPSTENVNLTLEVVEDMAIHFAQFDSFWGFEALNEPAWSVNMTILQNYYVDAYNIMRAYNPDIWIGFHDGFRGYDKSSWTNFFSDNDNFTKVFLDVHLYHVFGDMWGTMTIDEHLDWVHIEDKKHIDRYEGIVPVIIGEWSIGLPGFAFEGLDASSIRDVKTAFASAQFNVYEEGMGWFFWNYKIAGDGNKEWDFVDMVELGYFPENFSTN